MPTRKNRIKASMQKEGTIIAEEHVNNAFIRSKWFTRGWTLQELIAPRRVLFYNSKWQFYGTKDTLADHIQQITGIPNEVLHNSQDIQSYSIASRMSWAANRQTTRTEDLAYCLLGIFRIHMPLLYGEGENSFIRLQEEICKKTTDMSLFAWLALDSEGT